MMHSLTAMMLRLTAMTPSLTAMMPSLTAMMPSFTAMMLRLILVSAAWTPSLTASPQKVPGLSSTDVGENIDTCGRISCGVNAICANNQTTCDCLIGYEGDPFVRCNLKPVKSLNKTEPIEIISLGKQVPYTENRDSIEQVQAVQPSETISTKPSLIPASDAKIKETGARTSCQQTLCGTNAYCSDAGADVTCKCNSGYEGDPYVRCYMSPCQNNPCGLNADCSSSGHTAVCKCRTGYFGDPLVNCHMDTINKDTCENCGINAQCSKGACECSSGYVGDPYSRCHMDPCSPDLGNPCGENGKCYSVHNGVSAACKCTSSFPFGNPYYQCWSDPCTPDPCGKNTQCISNRKANAAACRCKDGYSGNPHTECLANPCEPSPCGNNAVCRHNGRAAWCTCPKDATGDPYVACSSKPRQPRANPCATGVCGKGTECANLNGRPVCNCLPGWQGDPYKECFRIQCDTSNDCAYKEACYNYQCIDPCTEPCGYGAECFVRNHVALCRCPEGTTGDAFVFCRKFTRDEICAPCGANTDCRVTVGNQPTCTCKPTYLGDPLKGCQRECESDSACGDRQRCDRQTYRCMDLCQPESSWPCGSRALCSALHHQETCSCPRDFLGDPYARCYTECTEAGDCSVDEECIRLRCKNVCHPEACGVGASCKGTGHQALCYCPSNYTGNPKVLCEEIIIKDPCVPNPCGQSAICEKKVLFDGRETVSCSCPVGFFGDPDVKCTKGECARDDDCPDDKACFPDHYCYSPCSPSKYPCGRDAVCHPTNHHGAVCSCPSGQVGDPLVACRRHGR